MRAISLFSGVGGFDLGFERAGIETVLQAERDPHCLKVLERHWPQTERVTDVRAVSVSDQRVRCGSGRDGASADGKQRAAVQSGDGDIDLIFGGFPCQDLSVAGKRAGLGGERSGLWFEFERVVSEIRPRWVCIENVPGLLSSNQGRDFAVILNGLDELGYGVAWNILDAQFFGVPQRRRRVFIVGCLGDERSAAAVLSVCEGGGGNPETGREAGERVADSLTVGANQTFGFSGDITIASPLTASAGHHGHSSPRGDGSDNLIANPFGAHHRRDDLDHDTYIPDVAYTIAAREAKGVSMLESQTNYVATSGVRRLTPLECQRLQGFPDWWYDGLDLADSHIYRQMGNAVCVPVAEWLGHRIMAFGGSGDSDHE
jgi:DNA (cytosine-5)-methyltransferase 1